ncbi:methionyl-tRNA formyltransferase, mitochondrial isoform X2 [Bufo gargarizans]|uniref:methionyl-tRNA formyltransferase, mitochondrial isoform X2 n=1 Tax=Bufo gargarizans TaxID=30331 RepID=UPI001CF27BCA|nr:methionyl-tRNA formyltransferase, mitochondrial isoform X2 [Bufo gargarizans]
MGLYTPPWRALSRLEHVCPSRIRMWGAHPGDGRVACGGDTPPVTVADNTLLLGDRHRAVRAASWRTSGVWRCNREMLSAGYQSRPWSSCTQGAARGHGRDRKCPGCGHVRLYSCGHRLSVSDGCSRTRPPWKVMFFGTDEFALECLKSLNKQRFDVGPIVMQKTFPVPPKCTSKELEAVLSKQGAEMLMSVLKDLPERLRTATEQPKEGATFAPKITAAMSCVKWAEQTPEQIVRLERAIGFAMPLQAVWMGAPIKLLNFVEVPDSLITSDFPRFPGSISYLSAPQIMVVQCKDGWVGIRTVKLGKKMSAKDFYNGYLHPWFVKKSDIPLEECRFHTLHLPPKSKTPKQRSVKNTGC